jgi:hypothetical protein
LVNIHEPNRFDALKEQRYHIYTRKEVASTTQVVMIGIDKFYRNAGAISVAVLSPLLCGAGSLGWLISTPSELQRTQAFVRKHLEHFGLFPVLVPNAQLPGDSFATDNIAVFYARAARCFGQLKVTTTKGANFLPTRDLQTTLGLEAAIGLPSLAEAKLTWDGVRSVRIAYDDVEIISSEIADLKTAFASTEQICAPLADLIQEKVTAPPRDKRLFVIIGTVVRAKRTVEIAFGTDTKANVGVSDIKRLIQEAATKVGYAISLPEVEAKFVGTETRLERITFSTNSRTEVAFAPAFLPSLIRKGLAGSPANTVTIEALQWTANEAGALTGEPALKNDMLDVLDAFGLQPSVSR